MLLSTPNALADFWRTLADFLTLWRTLADWRTPAYSGVLWRTLADFWRTLADSGGLPVVWRTSGGLADLFVAA